MKIHVKSKITCGMEHEVTYLVNCSKEFMTNPNPIV